MQTNLNLLIHNLRQEKSVSQENKVLCVYVCEYLLLNALQI